MGALDDLLQGGAPKPTTALDALIAQPKPAAPSQTPPPPAKAAQGPAPSVPTDTGVPEIDAQSKPVSTTPYKPPGVMDQVKGAASDALGDFTGNVRDATNSSAATLAAGEKQIGAAFTPDPKDTSITDRIMGGMKRDVTQLLPGLGKTLLGGLGVATAPVTGALQTEADAITKVTGDKDLGDRVSDVTGLVGGGEVIGGAKAMAGLSQEAKATQFLKDIAKAPEVEKVAAPASSGVTVYHGSPHKFEGFSSDPALIGDANNQYGKGVYVTTNKGIASRYGGQEGGNQYVYTAQMKSHPDQQLQWRKPLSEQSPEVQAKIKQVAPNADPSHMGQELYNDIAHANGGKQIDATNALRKVGVTGADLGDGVYTVFDPTTLRITERNGEKVGSYTPAPPPPGQVRMAPRAAPDPALEASAEATHAQLKDALGVAPGDARGLIRQKIGQGERASMSSAAKLEPFQAKINAMSPPDVADFLNHVEGRSAGGTLKDPTLQPVADTLRSAFKEREAALAASDPTAKMSFITDYFPHMWKNPEAAQNFLAQWGTGGKQGSGAATKARSIPTIAEGMAAGLVPKYANPLEAATMYTANMDRYIAINEVMNTAKSEGTVKYLSPGKQPAGWTEVKGRLGQKVTPAGLKVAYAPPEWARDYNNFVSRGWHDIDPKLGDLMANLRKASNAVTFAELSFSGYHVATMASEAVTSEVAKAVGELAGLRPDKAIASLIKAPTAPVTRAMTGRKAQQIYLDTTGTKGTPAQREMVDLLTQANMRMTGMDKTLRQTAAGSFFTAWKRGALKMQLMEDLKGIKGPISAVTSMARQIGRVAETIQQPIFEKYIPLLKNGAAMDQLKSWMAMNPTASAEQKLTATRKIVDSIDNRFGEMVQDNLFINQTMKQTAQIMMRSYSWNLGTIREIGGGALDIVKTGGKALSPKSEKWSPRASYVVALPMAYAFMNATYQYLKTGKPPESEQDLVAPRTGGVDQATGQPERASIPSYMKDVFGWYENGPTQEAWNKLATAPRAAVEVLSNKDWRGDPIRGPDPHQWVQNYFDYVTNTFGPIGPKQMVKGQRKGSDISTPETLAGVRPAPRYLTAPDQFKGMMDSIHNKAWRTKQKHDEKTKQQYGGTQ